MAKTVRAVVDRIEDGYAVVLLGDRGDHLDWPLDYLPDEVREGVVISIKVETDPDATIAAKSDIESMIDRLKRGE